MREKNKDSRGRRILLAISRYVAYFLLTSFIITCCMLLFLNELTAAIGVTLTESNLAQAAKLTFINVAALSLIFTVLDGIRRRLFVERPVAQIIRAAEKITQGDFSARIPRLRGSREFNRIAGYFNKMAEELSGMETLRTDFIANVSHELKTPLAVMQNYGTMLQQPNLSEEKRLEYAGAVTDASRRLAHLVSNILKLNKLENQQIFPVSEVYDLGEQLCACMLDFESAWEQKNLQIETHLCDGVLVKSDAEMLTLVWNNLFSNAVKFTEAGGKITLSLTTEGDFAVVQVSDTGCGISAQVGAHIFEKFYQGDASHAMQGNGLGLALVRRVIDIIGGAISVESEVGKGSTFTIKLRRITDETVQENPA